MISQLHWIDTTGGPHILTPVEYLDSWGGVEVWRENVQDVNDDYARACRITGSLGKISSGHGEVIVLSGDDGIIAWIPEDDTRGVLVRWLACDAEENIFEVLSQRRLGRQIVPKFEVESEEFETGPSGEMTLLDSSDSGADGMFDRHTFRLRPGRYRITASYVDEKDCSLVLMDVQQLSSSGRELRV